MKLFNIKLDSQKRKKVLIITYYWPPAGGPGVQRVLKFVKYLPEYGWEPIVLTVDSGEFPATDFTLADDVNSDILVHKTPTIEFFSLFKKFSKKRKADKIETFILDKDQLSLKAKIFKWIRANIFIPDGRIGWFPFAIRRGVSIIENGDIDLILSSSPPATVHIIASKLKSKTGIKWIADLRDPWVDAFWESKIKRLRIAQNKIEKQEKTALTNADHIVTATDSFKALFEKKYNLTNIDTLTNGYDLKDFKNVVRLKSEKLFIISYTGSIAESQNPTNFFKAISQLPSIQRAILRVNLYGAIDSSIIETIKALKLEEVVKFHGYIDHSKVTEVMYNSDLLMLLIPQKRGDIIPGKLFEYMGSGNPIISFGPKGDASKIIDEHDFGKHFEYNQDCTSFLETTIKSFIQNPSIVKKIPPQQFTRQSLTKKLAILMDKVTA